MELSASTAPTIDEITNEVHELRAVLKYHPQLFTKFYLDQCADAMEHTVYFNSVQRMVLMDIAKDMQRVEFPAGSMIAREDTTMEDAYIVASGEVRRWANVEGRQSIVTTFCPRSIGLLHLYNRASTSRYNAECLTNVVAYRITKDAFGSAVRRHPQLAECIIQELSWYIRSQNHQVSTPLLEQKSHKTSITATSVASFLESFYRSAMNNLINQRVTGVLGAWFPNMMVQTPVRVIYINGMKQIRTWCDSVETTHQWQRMLLSFTPGVVMCPFSSVLEAANVPMERNPRPLYARWTNGFSPRLLREVLFGLGINQLADFITERINFTDNMHVKGFAGSLSAGIISGYLSHIPHNISTMKLYSPNKNYSELWKDLYAKSVPLVPEFVPKQLHTPCAQAIACLFPIGVVRRSFQIGGTFMIINGGTYYMRDKDWY